MKRYKNNSIYVLKPRRRDSGVIWCVGGHFRTRSSIMRFFRPMFSVVIVCAFLSVTINSVFARTNRGSINGMVADPNGAAVANASVTAREAGTNTTYTTVTSGSGTYNFPQVLVGTYSVTVSSPGFKMDQRNGIVVQINTATVLKCSTHCGSASGNRDGD
jgi:carboxypeptidase family protein